MSRTSNNRFTKDLADNVAYGCLYDGPHLHMTLDDIGAMDTGQPLFPTAAERYQEERDNLRLTEYLLRHPHPAVVPCDSCRLRAECIAKGTDCRTFRGYVSGQPRVTTLRGTKMCDLITRRPIN